MSSHSRRQIGRVVAAATAAWLPAALLIAVGPGRWPDLPDVLPTHWGGFGQADGFAPAGNVWWTLFGLAAAGGGLAVVGALAHVRRRAAAGMALALAGGLAGGAAAVWCISASAATSGTQLGWRLVLYPVGLSYAAVVYALAGRGHLRRADGTPRPPGDGAGALSATQRAAWSVVSRSRLFVVVAGAALLVTTFLAAYVAPGAWLGAAAAAVTLMLFAETRITVDSRGLRLTAGIVHVPITRIPLTEIVEAHAAHIDPMAWGGWGYRVAPGRSALVLRAGPGLVVHRRDGRKFAVTVDDPETPARLLNAMLSNGRP
ncbi:DUF1648 domain-containing protein [Asanoa sp. WMMD1127]|uniref:DUF1648 domain-containing protein n=1 Tax=Asanoa sp. WMMD1127 TaxID=3016107 RepID=UPI002417E42F|nr:DUF1648 domain-containing protein [Asanoa sp. WMMD1127]MDG4824955.1 DUF1648 domain-containing protein [Asanoa sp. WMMD1127]